MIFLVFHQKSFFYCFQKGSSRSSIFNDFLIKNLLPIVNLEQVKPTAAGVKIDALAAITDASDLEQFASHVVDFISCISAEFFQAQREAAACRIGEYFHAFLILVHCYFAIAQRPGIDIGVLEKMPPDQVNKSIHFIY